MKALVTGGTGFVGGALARRLCGIGVQVTALGRNQVRGDALAAQGIRFLPVALEDRAAMIAACAGHDVAFHCGALSSPWERASDFYRANVLGTRHVVEGCVQGNVRRLIHVSTPSLYFHHNSRLNVKENDPLPERPVNEYVRTKRLAEQIINSADLFTITLRPRAIYGTGDTSLLPRIASALQAGRLPIIGDGQNVGSFTYIENLIDALLRAMEAPAALNKRTYNITNGEPALVWDIINAICDQFGFPKPTRHISYRGAFALAGALEAVYSLLPNRPEPPLTRYSVGVLALSQTLDISAARRDLEYAPAVTNLEGLKATCLN